MRTLMRRWYLGLLPLIAACDITEVQAPALPLEEEVGEPFVESLDAATLHLGGVDRLRSGLLQAPHPRTQDVGLAP